MDLPHRKAFEFLQRSVDDSLDAGERMKLERHLANCAECQTYAEMHRRLEEQALQHRPAALPSQKEIERAVRETEKHFRRWRMINRFFISPVRTVAWVGVAVVLLLAVIGVFRMVTQPNQTASSEVGGVVREIVTNQVEVTREVEVTRVVEVTPVFDAEAEKEAVAAASIKMDDHLANADREAALAFVHDDWMMFFGFPEGWGSWDYQDIGPDWWSEPEITRWDDYEVIVSPDLAVIRGERTNEVPGNGPVPVLATVVFTKENGQWKVIHGHFSYGGP